MQVPLDRYMENDESLSGWSEASWDLDQYDPSNTRGIYRTQDSVSLPGDAAKHLRDEKEDLSDCHPGHEFGICSIKECCSGGCWCRR